MTDLLVDTLDAHVKVERRFQRSIRVETDLGRSDCLDGYVAHETALAALRVTTDSIAKGQGAFTWTGPYGGGKSSLALALASCVQSAEALREQAYALVGSELGEAFGGDPAEWLPIMLTGRRGDPVADLREATAQAVAAAPGPTRTKRSRHAHASGADVVERLARERDARPNGGVLVIIDEMGKYLEGAGEKSVDIHFFQDLAEAANRSDGRLIVVGILHQSFSRYAERLGSKVQDEWQKIQGRYVDVPIVTATDEIIDLLGQAIATNVRHTKSAKVAKAIADEVALRRPGTPADFADRLDRCWPLHPVTAALLGPVTRRRFGQNERSLFGFLGSAEPNGFQDFLRSTDTKEGRTFEPAALWDYLRINLEPAIQASPDGHRWALAVDAIERAQRHGSDLHERITKTVAIIDLFRNGSGIVASRAVLAASIGSNVKAVRTALDELVRSSSLVFRRHLDAYAVYAGSDFDIEAEVSSRLAERDGLDVRTLNDLAGLRPILAKAHYFETGTPRWYDTRIAEIGSSRRSASDFAVSAGAAGRFVLALPSRNADPEEAVGLAAEASDIETLLPVIVGLPPNYEAIRSLGRELSAVRAVQTECPELEGDATARREVEARANILSATLEEEFRVAFDGARWFLRGAEIACGEHGQTLSRLASDQAAVTFSNAPLIFSELANRQRPSGNTNAAVKALLRAVAENTGAPRFGIEHYPPEVGLAATIYEATGLYTEREGNWTFRDPLEVQTKGRLGPLWRRTDDLLVDGTPLDAASIYEEWRQTPFGVRDGLMPVLLVAYLRTRQIETAIYINGTFQPSLTGLIVDLLLQDPTTVSFRRIIATEGDRGALEAYAHKAAELTGWQPPIEPLPVAQALVEFAFKLPEWSRHAHGALSPSAIHVRRELLHADDPYDLFVRALPEAVGGRNAKTTQRACAALQELHTAQPRMIAELRTKMLGAMKHQGENLEPLRRRAEAISAATSDDLKLGGFIARIAKFDGSDAEMEAICGLVTGQPVHTWRDLEPKRAAVQLADYAYRFRRVELFGGTEDVPTQTAVMMMAGVGSAERSVVRRAQISTEQQEQITPIARKLREQLVAEGLNQDLLLAVLAEVSHDLLEDDGEADVTVPIVAEGEEAAR